MQKQTQQILDRYHAGIEITQVQLQKVDPPAAVIESFRDVQRANTDAERMRNEAEAYRNDIVPRARGDAARIVAGGRGLEAGSIAQATGQTQRFLSVLTRLPAGEGRHAAAHVHRDDAGHPDAFADTGGGSTSRRAWCRSCRYLPLPACADAARPAAVPTAASRAIAMTAERAVAMSRA